MGKNETFTICGRKLTLPKPPNTPILYDEYFSRPMKEKAHEEPLEIINEVEEEKPKILRMVKRKLRRKANKT